MKLFSLKNKSASAKNRLVIVLAVFCTLVVVGLWLLLLMLTKPKNFDTHQTKPFREIKEQISSVIQQSKLEKISETKTELQNTLETLSVSETTPGQGTLSSTP